MFSRCFYHVAVELPPYSCTLSVCISLKKKKFICTAFLWQRSVMYCTCECLSALRLHTSDSDNVSFIPVVFVSLDVCTLEDSCPPVLILCIISQSEYGKKQLCTDYCYGEIYWNKGMNIMRKDLHPSVSYSPNCMMRNSIKRKKICRRSWIRHKPRFSNRLEQEGPLWYKKY